MFSIITIFVFFLCMVTRAQNQYCITMNNQMHTLSQAYCNFVLEFPGAHNENGTLPLFESFWNSKIMHCGLFVCDLLFRLTFPIGYHGQPA